MVDEGLRRAGLPEASRPDLARHHDNCALIIEHREQQQAKNAAAN